MALARRARSGYHGVMSNVPLRLSFVALCALGTLACESNPPRRRARPRPASSRTGTVAAQGGGATSVRLPEGHVAFAFRGADLETQVLPAFADQAGVQIIWQGEPRSLTLRLTQPTPWPDALDLVCQFTKTHATRDWQGRLILRDPLASGTMPVSGRATGLFFVGSSTGGMAIPWIIGQLFEPVGPSSVFAVVLANLAVGAVIFAIYAARRR